MFHSVEMKIEKVIADGLSKKLKGAAHGAQLRLAKDSGIPSPMIDKLKKKEHKRMSLSTAIKALKVVGVDLEEMILSRIRDKPAGDYDFPRLSDEVFEKMVRMPDVSISETHALIARDPEPKEQYARSGTAVASGFKTPPKICLKAEIEVDGKKFLFDVPWGQMQEAG